MIFRKEIEIEFDTDDYDITEFDFSFDEIQEAVKYNLTKEEQNRNCKTQRMGACRNP